MDLGRALRPGKEQVQRPEAQVPVPEGQAGAPVAGPG